MKTGDKHLAINAAVVVVDTWDCERPALAATMRR